MRVPRLAFHEKKLIQTAFAAVGTRTGPVPEVTGFLGFHGMGEELREGDRRVSTGLRVGGRSASGDTRRDEPEFGVGRVTGPSLPE
jgi:hypothetical protein